MKKITLDATDRQILGLLQRDAELSVQTIAEQIHLSVSPCWRRIQRMREQGVIEGSVALLNRQALDLGVDVFVFVRAAEHSDVWLNHFAEVLQNLPQVMEAYRMSGDVDYLLRVVVRDIQAYDQFYKSLVAQINVADISSSFAMERMKYTTALPIG